MTNRVGTLDKPALRGGRFDTKIGIYLPDPVSRIGRCLDLATARHIPMSSDTILKLHTLASQTHCFTMDVLGRAWSSAHRYGPAMTEDSVLDLLQAEYVLSAEKAEPHATAGKGLYAVREYTKIRLLDSWNKSYAMQCSKGRWKTPDDCDFMAQLSADGGWIYDVPIALVGKEE